MTRPVKIFLICCAALATQSITSCLYSQSPELVQARQELQTIQARKSQLNYPEGSYEQFVSHNGYPVTPTIYKNTALLAEAGKGSRVVICLAQQRGRLYVGGQVAADWPVSTGIPGRETPAGHYTVLEKKEEYASNRYGKMYNAEGKCINSDADVFTQEVPEGGKFVGSPMPYWQRLTHDGVGMHIGKVVAGRRLSHGCIRTPREMARELYRITRIGTKVDVLKELEPNFPAPEALSRSATQKQLETRERALIKKINALQQAELARRG